MTFEACRETFYFGSPLLNRENLFNDIIEVTSTTGNVRCVKLTGSDKLYDVITITTDHEIVAHTLKEYHKEGSVEVLGIKIHGMVFDGNNYHIFQDHMKGHPLPNLNTLDATTRDNLLLQIKDFIKVSASAASPTFRLIEHPLPEDFIIDSYHRVFFTRIDKYIVTYNRRLPIQAGLTVDEIFKGFVEKLGISTTDLPEKVDSDVRTQRNRHLCHEGIYDSQFLQSLPDYTKKARTHVDHDSAVDLMYCTVAPITDFELSLIGRKAQFPLSVHSQSHLLDMSPVQGIPTCHAILRKEVKTGLNRTYFLTDKVSGTKPGDLKSLDVSVMNRILIQLYTIIDELTKQDRHLYIVNMGDVLIDGDIMHMLSPESVLLGQNCRHTLNSILTVLKWAVNVSQLPEELTHLYPRINGALTRNPAVSQNEILPLIEEFKEFINPVCR